jgi:hypothetical protein
LPSRVGVYFVSDLRTLIDQRIDAPAALMHKRDYA